jgi:hypothetical protein
MVEVGFNVSQQWRESGSTFTADNFIGPTQVAVKASGPPQSRLVGDLPLADVQFCVEFLK